MRALVILAMLAGVAHADPDVHSVANDFALSRKGIGLDLDVSGGLRLADGDSMMTRPYFARARVGALLFHEPNFFSVGVAGMISPLASTSLGFEVAYGEVFHGFTAQAGIYPIDSAGGTIVSAQAGWALFGVEYQRRISGPREDDQAVIAVLHVPLGIVYQMMKKPPGVI
ncbi:MAG: hypothetical protein QM831_15690 [Kofleriaceae bacterium]